MSTCPICFSKDTTNRFEIIGARISYCAKCTHSFSHDVTVRPQDIYTHDYFAVHHTNWREHPNYALFDRIHDFSMKHCNKQSPSVLDIGCGTGDLLYYLSSKGWDDCTGIDFTVSKHDTIDFVQGDIFSYQFDRTFDLVISLATIEHVENVHRFVEILTSLTRPGGIVCLMTVDEMSWVYQLARLMHKLGVNHGIQRLYDPHHMNHFSQKSLRLLLQQHALRIDQQITINSPLAAIDLPKTALNFFIRPFLMGLMLATNVLGRKGFLQVVLAQRM